MDKQDFRDFVAMEVTRLEEAGKVAPDNTLSALFLHQHLKKHHPEAYKKLLELNGGHGDPYQTLKAYMPEGYPRC